MVDWGLGTAVIQWVEANNAGKKPYNGKKKKKKPYNAQDCFHNSHASPNVRSAKFQKP